MVLSRLLVSTLCFSIVFAHDQLPLAPSEAASFKGAGSSSSTEVNLHVWTRNGTRNDTAPYLSGIIFEDIAHSGDGGIYAELINNRAFQGSGVKIGSADPLLPGQTILSSENPTIPFAPTIDHWYAVGDARISLDYLHPLSDALQVSLQVDVPLNATGEVGIRNDGFWGMQVSPQTYNASFYVQTNSYRWNYTLTHFDVSLRDDATGDVFVSSTIHVNSSTRPVPYMYSNYSTQLINTATAPTVNNSLYVTMDADKLRGQTLYFDLISLFPETYKNRPNGLRKDLAEHLEAANYRFMRFPGGNNLEGYSIARRWKWWKTIGPLTERPGRPGDWSYFNTDGLGLLEYMYWCEDMNLAPLLDVYAGFSLELANYDQGNSTDGNELPMSLMGPILQEALDEMEYLTGNTSTYWGAQRAAHGHPEPFDVPFIELGNEDFFSHNYPARAEFMLNGMKAVYPNITYVYSAANLPPTKSGNYNITLPPSVIWDDHIYNSAAHFIEHFDQWDNWQTSCNLSNVSETEEVYAGLMEYHVNDAHPRMISAVAEAVYALGWERNPNTFKVAAFAPAIQNANFWRHTPYLILFDADGGEDLLSVSYYQQQMFNLHHGTQTLPVTADEGSDYNPLFWAAQIDTPKNAVYFKIVNAGAEAQTLDLMLDVPYTEVNGTILEPPTPGDLNALNDFEHKKAVVPKPIPGLQRFGQRGGWSSEEAKALFSWTVPAYSVSVLQFDLLKDH